MRQVPLLMLALFVSILIATTKVYGDDCFPTSTVCCEQNSRCTLGTNGFGSPSNFKQEHRTITFPIGIFETTVDLYPNGFGECGIKQECGNKSVVECWPKFNTPIAVYNYWSQDIHHQKASTFDFPNMCCCPLMFATGNYIACEDYVAPITFEATGPCGGSNGGGGGTGGSGSNNGGSVGFSSCTNYYWVTDWYDCPDGWTSVNQCNYIYTETAWAGCW